MDKNKTKRIFQIIVVIVSSLLVIGVLVAIVALDGTQSSAVPSGPSNGGKSSETEQSEESSEEESSREESEESSVGESENTSESEESSSEQSETVEPYITRDGTIWDGAGYPQSVKWSEEIVWGTQEDLDSFNRLIHSDKIAYIDVGTTGNYTKIPLPAEYANEIWRIFCSLEISVITSDDDAEVSTGGAEYITAYDESDNVLFCVSIPLKIIVVNYSGEDVSYWFNAYASKEEVQKIRNIIYQCISEYEAAEKAEDKPYITRDGTLWEDGGYPMSFMWGDNRVWGTQEDLDSFNRLIHSDKIAYIDVSFTGGGNPMSIPLSAEYADAIWKIFLSLDIEVITEHENISTGGAEYITAYDEADNVLFCVAMPGGPISIKYPGEPTIIEFAAGDKYEIRRIIYQCIDDYEAANK